MRIPFALGAAVVVASTFLSAQATSIPNSLPFQGRLVGQNGNPANGVYSMTFKVYDKNVGGTALWRETNGKVTVTKGVFKTNLGLIVGFPQGMFDGNTLYLGLTVGNDAEMTPRFSITS